jgi:hypothetical protein
MSLKRSTIVSQDDQRDTPVGHIVVAKDPTPEGEGGFFSSDDESVKHYKTIINLLSMTVTLE